jgi:hypothetical protein
MTERIHELPSAVAGAISVLPVGAVAFAPRGASSPGGGAILDPVIDEVPLSAYAAVLAYTSEGLPLDVGLEHAGIEGGAWPAIEAGFTELLAESAADGPALLEAFDAHVGVARGHVERRLPPLDEDLGSWLDLFRAFTAASDPLGFLAARGLTEADVFRLLALWQARTAADRALGEMAGVLFAAPAGPAPEVRPAPPMLRPETKRARVEKPRAKALSLAATAPMPFDFRSLTLPFLSPADVPVVLPPPSPKVARKALGETTPVFVPHGAPVLPFGPKEADRAAAPPMPPPLVHSPPIPPMPPMPPPYQPYPQPMPPMPPPLVHSPPMPPMPPPLVHSPPMPPMPPPVVRAARASLGETAPVAFKSLSATLPFVAPTGPSPMATPSAAEVDPWARKGASAILRGETTADLAISPKPVLPFTPLQAPATSPQRLATGTRLSLEAYAAMSGELASNPAGIQATLLRYGLTAEGKRAEDAAWQARFAEDPALRMAWIRELMEAGKRR